MSSAAHLPVFLFLCSSGGSARRVKGVMSAQKIPSRVQDGDEGVAGRNGVEITFPDKGSSKQINGALQANQLFVSRKKQKKIEVVARPANGCSSCSGLRTPAGLSSRQH